MERGPKDRDTTGSPSEEPQPLRDRAEAMLQRMQAPPQGKGDPDAVLLRHELSVHEIELELQNEELQRANREIEEARQKYYDLYDRAPVAYVTLDQNGGLMDMNLAAAILLNRPRGMLRERFLQQFVVPREFHLLDGFLRKTFSDHAIHGCEVSLAPPGTSAVVVRLEGFQAESRPGDPPVCRAVMIDITARRRAEAALQASEEATRRANEALEYKVAERTVQLSRSVEALQDEMRRRIRNETELATAHEELHSRATRLRDLAGDITRAVQRERERFATVLHDDVQQILAAIRLRVGTLGRHEGDPIREHAAEILALLDECVANCRSLTAEVHPPVLKLEGLTPAFSWLARMMAEKHGLRIDVTTDGEIPQVPEEMKLLLFETARELLFNVVKHARVDSAALRFGATDGALHLTVSDAGRGFVPDPPAPSGTGPGGFGLFNIRERLALVGGSLQIVSAPGQGCRCAVTIPIGPVAGVEPPPAAVEAAPASAAAHRGAKIRVLLVDDHAMVRAGLATLLAQETDMEVVGQAGDGLEAIALADRLRPDVILMDIRMPNLDGIGATHAIRSAHPETRVIGLSMHQEAEHADAMRNAGAEALLSKSGEPDILLGAIRACAKP